MEQSILNIGNWIFSGFWHFVGCLLLLRAFCPLRFNILHEYKRGPNLAEIWKAKKDE